VDHGVFNPIIRGVPMSNQPSHEKPDQRGKAGRVGPERMDMPQVAKGIERADAPRTEPSHQQHRQPTKPKGGKKP
jgi:hypothetical protein